MHYASSEGQSYFSRLGLLVDGNYPPNKCRMPHLFECYTFGIIFSPTKADMDISFLMTYSRTGASGKDVSPPTTGHQNGPKWSGVFVEAIFFF